MPPLKRRHGGRTIDLSATKQNLRGNGERHVMPQRGRDGVVVLCVFMKSEADGGVRETHFPILIGARSARMMTCGFRIDFPSTLIF